MRIDLNGTIVEYDPDFIDWELNRNSPEHDWILTLRYKVKGVVDEI